ncbi:redox-sensing transcriptional repressor Rex [Speluncibacter jeojiensis]|uniref:Redox-sensing transcriptional repressor Rex n=1 Tax=Speluncibacter jeojiensis TaxID=2710754 RepID=A0A9X4M882_9ACTN|nr:redox-sensing transcriptional repressor Rex [Corynebacteriales bacterium D3-21]
MAEEHQAHGRDTRRVGVDVPAGAPREITRDIPNATVGRLALYLRVLSAMAESGTELVSSEQLAEAAGVGSAKLRKDLSFLGSNGVRGVGYDVDNLIARIETALGLDRGHRVVLVGVGNLGHALAGYGGFGRRGFSMVALFDVDPALVGTTVRGLPVRHMNDLDRVCAEVGSTIGVIATPPEAAQAACDRLVDAGVHSILNFAPVVLQVPEHIEMRRVDLAVEMQVLSFHIARNARQAAGESAGREPRRGARPGVLSAARQDGRSSQSVPGAGSAGNTSPRSGSVVAQ